MYLVRHMPPEQAARIKALGIPGVYLLREYRRYYPAGEVAGHVVGFTTVDDKGQEGLELGFDQLLNGEDGAKRVIQDSVRALRRECRKHPRAAAGPRPRHQHRSAHPVSRLPRAESGDAGISRARRLGRSSIDVDTGEVLAMVNQPSYNPNDREQLKPACIAIAPRPTFSSRARASSRSSWPRRWPPGSTAPTAWSTPRRDS